jgi:hypothetical protein
LNQFNSLSWQYVLLLPACTDHNMTADANYGWHEHECSRPYLTHDSMVNTLADLKTGPDKHAFLAATS